MSKQEILKVLIEQEDAGTFLCRDTLEHLFDVPWSTVESYLTRLAEEKYLTLVYGDDEILRIFINASTRARLLEAPSTAPMSIPPLNIYNRGGNITMGIGDNRGANITIQQVRYEMKQTVQADLLQMYNTVDRHTEISSSEATQIKELLRQILKCLDKSDAPPVSLLEELSSRIQKHAWIAAPLATMLLKFLEKLW